ncbi:hypothetical protein WICMUC_000451 [Wickerhamomyces mucosus]|uniref:Uncharacterized protein n=1 Tax=Wickerhamomyces mucosus TaxID=1378264 RepID=A0A9P8TIP8_9ASCO|nr:hypothetical protein WICMUC_000451 [Wickerhamomyces mucosus]
MDLNLIYESGVYNGDESGEDNGNDYDLDNGNDNDFDPVSNHTAYSENTSLIPSTPTRNNTVNLNTIASSNNAITNLDDETSSPSLSNSSGLEFSPTTEEQIRKRINTIIQPNATDNSQSKRPIIESDEENNQQRSKRLHRTFNPSTKLSARFNSFEAVQISIYETLKNKNSITKLPQLYEKNTGSAFFYTEVHQSIIIPRVNDLLRSNVDCCEACLLPVSLTRQLGFQHRHLPSDSKRSFSIDGISNFCPLKVLVLELVHLIVVIDLLDEYDRKQPFNFLGLMQFSIEKDENFTINSLKEHHGVDSYDCFPHQGVTNLIAINKRYSSNFSKLFNDFIPKKCDSWFNKGSLLADSNEDYFAYSCKKFHTSAAFVAGTYGLKDKASHSIQGQKGPFICTSCGKASLLTEKEKLSSWKSDCHLCLHKKPDQIKDEDYKVLSCFIHFLFVHKSQLTSILSSPTSVCKKLMDHDIQSYPVAQYVRKLEKVKTFGSFCSIIFARFKARYLKRDQFGKPVALQEFTMPLWFFIFLDIFKQKEGVSLVKITLHSNNRFGKTLNYISSEISQVDTLPF